MVFGEEVFKALLHVVPHHCVLVVPVVEDTVWVSCSDIEPRVFLRRAVAVGIPVEFCPRMCAGGVIIDHVHYDRHTPSVALVDELLVFLPCAVGLVEGEIVVRIVAPADVAVEFLDWHKLDCCDSEILQIVHLCHSTLDVSGLGEVTEKELVDYKVVLVGNLEVVVLPVIDRLIDLECGNEALCSGWELRNSGDVLVVPLVIDNLSVRVTHLDGLSVSDEEVFKTVFLADIESFNVVAAELDPPASLVVVSLHRVLVHTGPFAVLIKAEITHHVTIFAVTASLVLVVEHQNHLVVHIVDAQLRSRRNRLIHNRIRLEWVILILVIDNICEEVRFCLLLSV